MKVLAIVHFFYKEQWNEIKECLSNIAKYDDMELFVTMPEANISFTGEILASFGNAHVKTVDNIGYDIWPFLDIINGIDLNAYDILVKLHTKRDMQDSAFLKDVNVGGSFWRDNLLEFCRTPQAWKRTRNFFRMDEKTGLVSNDFCIFSESSDPSHNIYPYIKKILKDMGLTYSPSFRFVAGSMFAARPRLFQWVQGKYSEKDFFRADNDHSENIAHYLERVLGYAIGSQGYSFASISQPEDKLIYCLKWIKRFIYKKRLGIILLFLIVLYFMLK